MTTPTPTPELTQPSATPQNAALLAVLVAAVFYTATLLFKLSPLLYLPVEARWVLPAAKPEGAVSMAYYGAVLNALAAILVGYTVGRLPPVATLLARPGVQRLLFPLTALVVAALMVFITVYELSKWAP